jgi:hypothetical protein
MTVEDAEVKYPPKDQRHFLESMVLDPSIFIGFNPITACKNSGIAPESFPVTVRGRSFSAHVVEILTESLVMDLSVSR